MMINILKTLVLLLMAYTVHAAEPETVKAEDVYMAVAQDAQDTGEQIPKKKLVIAQFEVANTLHVDDISNIYDGLPAALASRLEASGDFLPVYDGRAVPIEPGALQREAILQIAGKTGAQFLITGMVANAGFSKEKGFLGTSLGGQKARYIDIELAVYDGNTGERLWQRRFSEQVQGDARVGNNKPFGSGIFFATDTGQAFNRLLDAAVKELQSALKNVLFSAHIIRVQEKTVYLDVGGDSLLKPGDKFVAYTRDTSAPILGLNGAMLGVAEHAADTITLTLVQPQFSIGELSEVAVKHGVKAGHIVRINPEHQRDVTAKQAAEQKMRKAEQDAADEIERMKNVRAAQDEADRVKAEQAEIARIEEAKRAKAQAAAEAKEAKLKVKQEAKIKRNNAAQEARDRELARSSARARAAELKATQKAEAERIKAEKKAKAEADAKAAAEARAAELKARQEAQAEAARIKAEELKAKQEALAEAARIKAEEKAIALAEAKAAAEIRAAELKAKLEALREARAEATRLKAEEKAREQARAAAEARAPRIRRDARMPAETDDLLDDDEGMPITEEQAAQAEAEEEAWLETEYKAAAVVKAAELRARVKAARIKAEQAAPPVDKTIQAPGKTEDK